MNLSRRSYQRELLDSDNIPFEDIKKNLQELEFINKWLGGHSITLKGLQQLAGDKKELFVCEIGSGGGDNLVAIIKWCKQKNTIAKCIGIDIKEECIAFAKQNEALKDHATWITKDYKEVSLENKPDVIFSSLFCHHFSENELIQQVQWMKENSPIGFFINDLERNAIAYHSIRLLTNFFSNSYLVRNDAPLSVARGLIKNEWKKIFSEAGINKFNIRWQWAFRYLITYKHG